MEESRLLALLERANAGLVTGNPKDSRNMAYYAGCSLQFVDRHCHIALTRHFGAFDLAPGMSECGHRFYLLAVEWDASDETLRRGPRSELGLAALALFGDEARRMLVNTRVGGDRQTAQAVLFCDEAWSAVAAPEGAMRFAWLPWTRALDHTGVAA